MATDNDNSEATDNVTEFSEDDLFSLGQKLAALDLTDAERAALAALVDDNDVGGFGRFGVRFDIVGDIRKGMGLRRRDTSGKRADNIMADWATNVQQQPKPGRF